MTKKQALKLKRKRKRQKLVREVISFFIFTILAAIFMNMSLKAWDAEIEAHSNYNKEYVREMKMARQKNNF